MAPAKLMFAIPLFAVALCAQSTGSLSGFITNSLNGTPIDGVKVRAGCLSGGATLCKEATAVTDTTGKFFLSGLTDGRYVMSVEKDGFSPGLSNPVGAVASSKESRWDAKLTPLGSLQGRVIDPDGKPVAGVTIQFGFAPNVITDDQGVFVIRKISPTNGPLYVKVLPQPAGKNGERMVNTYYPSVLYADQAIPVKVQGTELSGYEIRLRIAQARRVRGVLRNANGDPIAHAQVSLATTSMRGIIPIIRGVFAPQRFSPVSAEGDHRETGADGAFEFPAVVEGDWILKSYLLGTGNRQGGATEVRVGRSDIDDVTLRLTAAFPIEVSTEISDAQSSEPPSGGALLLPMDGQLLGGGGRDVDPPFTVHDQGLPGGYLVAPDTATRGYYVSAAMLNGRDVLWQRVQLSEPTDIKLILKKDGGTLRGVVEKGGGSTVVLMAEQTAYARFGVTARCDPDGSFSIADVPPGNYIAVVFQDNQVLYRSDFLVRVDSANGKRIKIEPSATESVSLRAN